MQLRRAEDISCAAECSLTDDQRLASIIFRHVVRAERDAGCNSPAANCSRRTERANHRKPEQRAEESASSQRVSANKSSAPGDAMLFRAVMQHATVVTAFAGRRFEHIVHRGRGVNQSTATGTGGASFGSIFRLKSAVVRFAAQQLKISGRPRVHLPKSL